MLFRSYYLPASEGGHLEDVRAIVEDLLARTQARRLAGPRLIRSAIADLARGDQLAAAGDVKGAYDAYAEAYRALVR